MGSEILKTKKRLNIQGTLLGEKQLEQYLEKMAAEHTLRKKSNKSTYPIERLKENFIYITNTYDLLNQHMKAGILIHPAGEWLLDNYYIIEENYRMITRELTPSKYTHFVGMADGPYEGFARIYVLAAEMVAYTDGKINPDCLKALLEAYQTKKTLNMEEIWSLSLFFNIALIEKIRTVAERITYSQMQKERVESMLGRHIEGVEEDKQGKTHDRNHRKIEAYANTETFVEYLSYRLKLYGKKGAPYLKILEEQVARAGSNITDMIRKEHFNIALQKVYMGNCIKSMQDIQRINFTEIFEEINGVENVLKKDPSAVYERMDHPTKAYYRNVIKELSKKSKISEMYITKKALELASKHIGDANTRKSHIGYYLISEGKQELIQALGLKPKKERNTKNLYIASIVFWTSIVDFALVLLAMYTGVLLWQAILLFLLLYIPTSEVVIKIQQYVLGKVKKPTLIPKLYFQEDIPEEYSTMVVVPTIVKSASKVKEMLEKLEVFYLANQSENLYFTLLADCSSSQQPTEPFDDEIVQAGKQMMATLNEKYPDSRFAKFQFIYRKRTWNEQEQSYLGWERKRGFLTQLNEILVEKKTPQEDTAFLYNSMAEKTIPDIKYVITLDADTNLALDTAKKLIGAMAHILNTPVIRNGKVVEGYGVIQPRIGIDIESTQQSLFTQIFAGNGGVDFYSNAISDVYQDNFKEGIYTGKGIYDVSVFHALLKDAIPENTVLSHDLLEGLYLKCGLASDILLLDSYPSTYQNYITRQARWIRGDWQILGWLRKKVHNREKQKIQNPLGELDKFKILDNLRRSLLEITQVLAIIAIIGTQGKATSYLLLFVLLSVAIDLVIDLANAVIYKKEGLKKQKYFSHAFSNMKASCLRTLINFIMLPYRAYISGRAVIVTLHRLYYSHMHLLEWMTAEEAEQHAKGTVIQPIKNMWPNKKQELKQEEISYLKEVAQATWKFFEDNLTEEHHYLPPDNYQEDRKNKLVDRTSSTNIGLAMMSVMSAYDLKLITLETCLHLLDKILETVRVLPKWHGHLYNWYNITTLEPLRPMYVSSVDSGNFTGYSYVTKAFLEQMRDSEKLGKSARDKAKRNALYLEELIKETDFSMLYDPQTRLLSIGFNIEENKLTPSYYDLLASEARQASLVAIAKRDIPSEHWNYLSRTLTAMDGKKGLVSWSGTAFEYLMPNINIKKYKGSLLDESCKFMLMSQKKYCKRLGVPWGISEAAFNLKDLHANYQYKAFGIPWLGLKRGLADEVVVSSYGSIMALEEDPEGVIENMKRLASCGMYQQYGFYESIDFTPERVRNNQKYEVVKTYMAHHQALILLSINNFLNHRILQERFRQNPEIKAVDILLQEKMPEDMIVTKEKKEVVQKMKYKGYNNYIARVIPKVDLRIHRLNVIANENYMVCMNQDGTGFSKYKGMLVNRYKETDKEQQGIQFYFKNTRNGTIWSSMWEPEKGEKEAYTIAFSPDQNRITKQVGGLKTTIKNMVTPNENVEIRSIQIKNVGRETETVEISSILESVLSTPEQDYAHKAFNNLFLQYEAIENGVLVKRKARDHSQAIYLAAGLFAQEETLGGLEYEIDKQKLYGRLNTGIPQKIQLSEKFSNEIGLVVDPVISFRRTVKVPAGETVHLNLIISVGEDKLRTVHQLNQYMNFERVENAFEVSRIRIEEEEKYLGIKGRDVETYQTLLGYLIKSNPMKKRYLKGIPPKQYHQQDLWQYGISGDKPLLLVKIKEENDIYTVKEILKAYEYCITKKVAIDLVILDGEENVYEPYVKDEVEREIYHRGLEYLLSHGIYVLNTNQIEDETIFFFKANLIIDAHQGNLATILKEMEEEYLMMQPEKKESKKLQREDTFEAFDFLHMDLQYATEYGGFSPDGKEYHIAMSPQVPLAWSNVLANQNFGSVVTQNLGGYTWSRNSRLNRISRWSNNAVSDVPSETLFVQDTTNQKAWRIGEGNGMATFGFGYAKYEQRNPEIIQQLEVFVPIQDNVKVSRLKIKNNENKNKTLRLLYKIDTVLGEDELKTNGCLHLYHDQQLDCLVAENRYPQDVTEKVYVYSSEPIKSYTGDADSFQPWEEQDLNREDSFGADACMAVEIEVQLHSYEEKEVVFVLGTAKEQEEIVKKFATVGQCDQELYRTKKYWEEVLGTVKVSTPVDSFNIMMNGWTMYQTIASRLYARSGFYQSGGAFGFRDQLQDCLGMEYLDTAMVKEQIVKHAKHQFVEGDVEHWWHQETKRGIRTKFSDDRLWLVYLVLDYIAFTADKSILEEKVPYIKGKILGDKEDENYDFHERTSLEESIYQHCKRAINASLHFGEHGLPLIGTGDWNDGFNTVGNQGKGESVWLGFFLYDILRRFINITQEKGEVDITNQYEAVMHKLKKALNHQGWDGSWYKRAYTDEGKALGSAENTECRIDSIAQSWAVISDAGENNKKYIALGSLENNLINKSAGIIKLLDPPFDKSDIEPGYIKSYLPGVRENGGQYTHAAIWSVIAFAKLGLKEKALSYFMMINPIEHASTKENQERYKIEPYVISADIYGSQNLLRTWRMELVYGLCKLVLSLWYRIYFRDDDPRQSHNINALCTR